MSRRVPFRQMNRSEGVQNIKPPENPDELSISIDDRQPLKVLVHHDSRCLSEDSIGSNRHHFDRHYFRNLAIGVIEGVMKLADKIGVGGSFQADRYVHTAA